MRLPFRLDARDPGSRARAATLLTAHGPVSTPVFMAVGTFIAYEFGRGSAPHSPAPPAGESSEPPVLTDPSN